MNYCRAGIHPSWPRATHGGSLYADTVVFDAKWSFVGLSEGVGLIRRRQRGPGWAQVAGGAQLRLWQRRQRLNSGQQAPKGITNTSEGTNDLACSETTLWWPTRLSRRDRCRERFSAPGSRGAASGQAAGTPEFCGLAIREWSRSLATSRARLRPLRDSRHRLRR
jgi:hypothetical protein